MIRCFNCMGEYEDDDALCPHCGFVVDMPTKRPYFLPHRSIVQDRYFIGKSLGDGGFGITYKAWDMQLEKVVCIKEFYPLGVVQRAGGEKQIDIFNEFEFKNGLSRFLEEARTTAMFIAEDKIVDVFDFFEENNTAYMVMEYLEGNTFKAFIKKSGGKINWATALEMLNPVMLALETVHKKKILHRDISPDNIFVLEDGRVKLIDFGAARLSSTEDEKTRSMIVFKRGYAPVEQYDSKSKQGPYTDVYALGATLYNAITGVMPEESTNRAEKDELIAPKELDNDIPESVNNAILRAMAIIPEIRFQSVKELREALNSKNVRNAESQLSLRKKIRIISMLAATVLIAVITLSSFMIRQHKREQAAVLDDASITVWLCAEEGKSPEEMSDIFSEAIVNYQENYPQIQIDIKCFEKEEYINKLNEAISSDTLPTLFDSTYISADKCDSFADINSVFDYVSAGDYYFLNNYKKYYPSGKKMPTSVSVPVMYVNSTDTSGMGDVFTREIAVSSRNYATYYNVYSGAAMIKNVSKFCNIDISEETKKLCNNAETDFVNNTVERFLGDTGMLEYLEKNFPGGFSVDLIEENGIVGNLTDCYSVSDSASDDEKRAAIMVVAYLLSNYAQDVINIQNSNELPIKKDMITRFTEVNPQFTDIEKSLNKLIIAGEDQPKLNNWYDKIDN